MIPRFVPKTLAIILSVGLACVSDPGEPLSRWVTGTVVSPNLNEGAALIEISGAGLEDVRVDGGRVFTTGNDRLIRAVIVLDEPGSLRFRVRMVDPTVPVSASVLEVADGSNEVRASLAGYDVDFAR